MMWRALVSVGLWLCLVSVAPGQSTESLSGKVGAVEAKGKSTRLTVTTEVGDQTYDLPPKVELEILSTGDDACLVAGLLVKIDAVESNKAYFATVLSVYPEFEGKAPPAAAVKAPKEIGQSQNRHFITGEIVSYKSQPDEKYDLIELKGAGRNVLSVYVERQHSVRVVQSDPSHIAVNQAVTVTGRKAGTRLIPTKVTVNTGTTLQGEEFAATLKRKK